MRALYIYLFLIKIIEKTMSSKGGDFIIKSTESSSVFIPEKLERRTEDVKTNDF